MPGGPPLRVALAGDVCFGGMKSKIVLSLRSSSARQSEEPTGLPPIDTKQPGSPGSCAPTPLRPPPRASSGLTSVVGNTSGPGRTPPPPARAHRPPVRSRDGTTEASALDGAVCIGEWRHNHTPTHRSRLDTGHGLFSRHLVLRLHGRPTHTSTLRPTDLASTPDRPLQPPLGPGPPRPAVSHTQCHPNNSENEGSDSPRGPEQRSSDQDEGDSLPWHAQYRGTTDRRNNQPSQSETNKPTVHFRWEPPGAYHPVRSSEQPTSPNRPSNQPVQTQQTE